MRVLATMLALAGCSNGRSAPEPRDTTEFDGIAIDLPAGMHVSANARFERSWASDDPAAPTITLAIGWETAHQNHRIQNSGCDDPRRVRWAIPDDDGHPYTHGCSDAGHTHYWVTAHLATPTHLDARCTVALGATEPSRGQWDTARDICRSMRLFGSQPSAMQVPRATDPTLLAQTHVETLVLQSLSGASVDVAIPVGDGYERIETPEDPLYARLDHEPIISMHLISRERADASVSCGVASERVDDEVVCPSGYTTITRIVDVPGLATPLECRVELDDRAAGTARDAHVANALTICKSLKVLTVHPPRNP
jgi:hypothetical protein